MSGTNVWLKLRGQAGFSVEPFLLAPHSSAAAATPGGGTAAPLPQRDVWALPYAAILRHTVEEVVEACLAKPGPEVAAVRAELAAALRPRSGSGEGAGADVASLSAYPPRITPDLGPSAAARRLTVAAFVAEAKAAGAIVFIALHGGAGEDGSLQALLEESQVPFTGSPSAGSRLCMDKVSAVCFAQPQRLRLAHSPLRSFRCSAHPP